MRTTVYAKTSLGRQEIDRQTHDLTAKERRILFLVDAKRKTHEIAAITGLQNEIDTLLEHLHADGFIQPVGGDLTLIKAKIQAIQSTTMSLNDLPSTTMDHPTNFEALLLIERIIVKVAREHFELLETDLE